MNKACQSSNKEECLVDTAVKTVSTEDQCSEPPQNKPIDPDSFHHEMSEENLLESLNSNSSTAKGEQEEDHQVISPTDEMLNKVNVEILGEPNRRLWKHCCAECLQRVQQELEYLFVRSWMRRGSKVSLVAADEVIGTCCSAISIELDAVFHMDEAKRTIECVTSSLEGSCMCADKHKEKKNVEISPVSYANDNEESVVQSGSESIDSNNEFCTKKLLCLCPLIKLISCMK